MSKFSKRRFFIFTLFFIVYFFFGMDIVLAREIFYGTETEKIIVAYGGPTIFRFSEPVKTITQASRFTIKPADENSPDYAMLAVTPRFSEGQNNVTFVLASGTVINTKIITVSKSIPEKTDSFYDFKPRENILERESKEDSAARLNELELLKAMIRGENVTGYQVRDESRLVNTAHADISARLVRIYLGPEYNGYVFRIKNHSAKKEYVVDLENLTLGTPSSAVLAQIDQKTLAAAQKGETASTVTHLRIVAKPSSVYYNVNLPIAAVPKK